MGQSQRAEQTAGWGFGHYLSATLSALCDITSRHCLKSGARTRVKGGL